MSTTITIRDDTGKIILGKNICQDTLFAIVPEPSLTDRVKNWNATNPVNKCEIWHAVCRKFYYKSNKLRTNI